MSLAIGNWIRIKAPGRKWHLVESVIAGDAVTRCGRRIPDPDFDTSSVMPLTRMIGQPQNCRYCDRPSANTVEVSGGLAVEDDANTSPVDPT